MHRVRLHPALDFSLTKHYCCVMIPELVDIKSIWNVLPEGVHDGTLEEIKQRFAYNLKRKQLFEGFINGINSLRKAGCRIVFLDGSFVTSKPTPGDFDACWDPLGVDARKLNPVLLDFSNKRKKQKETFGGEFFLSTAYADSSSTFVDYFQTDKDTGKRKGIIGIQLL